MHPGKILIAIGLLLLVAGLLSIYGGRIPLLGRLPGDIRIEKENFSFYFPLASCLAISALISFILWLFRR